MTTTGSQQALQIAFAKRFYDGRANSYDSTWHPSFVRNLLALVDLQPGNHVLDLACGTGLVTFLSVSRVSPPGRVVGIDVSTGMLSVARAKHKELQRTDPAQGASVTILEQDIMNLDSVGELDNDTLLKLDSFDYITCASALVLLSNPIAAVRQWRTYLKPGTGRIVVDVPNPRNYLSAIVMERVARHLGRAVAFHRAWVVSDDSLREVLEEEGLVVEKYEFLEQVGYGRRWYPKHGGEKIFDEHIGELPFESLRAEGVMEKAKAEFVRQWEALANAEGRVEEVDGVWVAVARREV